MSAPALHSPSLYERPGYRTLLGRVRDNVRLYIRKQLELPRQEIAEIVQANLRAAIWFGKRVAPSPALSSTDRMLARYA